MIDSTILITGGTGSWAHELVSQLLEKYSPREIRIYSRGEHKQVEMKRKYQDDRLKYYIGDVRDGNRLMLAAKNVDYIFHLAALKHVPVCEENPWEAVQTNIVGTQNVITAALENKVRKVIDVSTDKAVDPLNLYGVTKACGEKLIIAANLISSYTRFACVRGGNVIGTNGSVVPLFKEQIARINEVTLTNDRMTRFFMRVQDAIELVLKATIDSIGGEIFVMKMPGCKITDLADVMIRGMKSKNAKVKFIGIRPGEKLYEVLISRYETNRTFDLGKFFVILPQINIPATIKHYEKKGLMKVNFEEFSSNSTEQMDKKSIHKLLDQDGWFQSKKIDSLSYLQSLPKKDLLKFYTSEGWNEYYENRQKK